MPVKDHPKIKDNMVYRVIGLMSGSALDGLDIVFVEFQQVSGKWEYTLRNAACHLYSTQWVEKLRNATSLKALDYQLLHTEYGRYIGHEVNTFIDQNHLQYQVQLIASHGHTSFHLPRKHMTAQLGDGASIAAITGINVVSDLRAIDVALGGQGAPIVPVGERLLFGDYQLFLNLGGIANLSVHYSGAPIAFDVCPANRVLNMLAKKAGMSFDEGGRLAEKGKTIKGALEVLNGLEYYALPYPKSLSNDFGTDVVYPLIANERGSVEDLLRTYVEHICHQVAVAVSSLPPDSTASGSPLRMLVTGGGAKNDFLIKRLTQILEPLQVVVETPPVSIIDYKEAIVMALLGVLRWREENNTLASVTGASRDSIGGAVWMGLEA